MLFQSVTFSNIIKDFEIHWHAHVMSLDDSVSSFYDNIHENIIKFYISYMGGPNISDFISTVIHWHAP